MNFASIESTLTELGIKHHRDAINPQYTLHFDLELVGKTISGTIDSIEPDQAPFMARLFDGCCLGYVNSPEDLVEGIRRTISVFKP